MFKKTVFTLLLTFTILSAGERIITLNFSPDKVKLGMEKGYTTVSYEDLGYVNPLGSPMLPSRGVIVLIPATAAYTGYEIVNMQTVSLGKGFKVMPQQKPVPISFKVPEKFIEPDKKVYSKNEFYPENVVSFTHLGSMSGFRLASFVVHPVIYNPVTGEIRVITTISFKVKYAEGKRNVNPITIRQLNTLRTQLKALVANPEDINAFAPPLRN